MKPITVGAGGASAGGAFAFVVVLNYILGLYNVELPADVATAVGTLLTMGAHYLVALNSHKGTEMDAQEITNTVETAVNALAPVAEAVVASVAPEASGIVTEVEGAIGAAESTATAVVSSLAGGAAPVAAAAAGAAALADAPVVKANPTVAAHIGILSSFIQWLESTVGKL